MPTLPRDDGVKEPQECDEHRDRRPERRRIMEDRRTAAERGVAAHVVEKLPWGHIEWAHADLRVLIEEPDGRPCLPCRHLLPQRDLERPQGPDRRHRRRFDPRRLPAPRLRQPRAQRRDPDHARPRSGAIRAVVLRAAQFRILPVARLAPLHRRNLLPSSPADEFDSRRWRPLYSISGAGRARASSTYAACRGDHASPRGGAGRRRLIICQSIIY